MKKVIFVFLLLFGINFVCADSNGIWHKVEDLREGIFGLDENSTFFEFQNLVKFNGGENRSIYAINFENDAIAGITNATGKSAIYGFANNSNAYSGYFEGGRFRIATGNFLLGTGKVGVGILNPTQRLDVNGKIKMRNQTVSTDANNIVTTKGYVDNLVLNSSAVEIGYIGLWAGSNLPDGYLWCDGSRVSQSLYPDLYGIVGDNYVPNDPVLISGPDSFVRNGAFTQDWSFTKSISSAIKEGDVRLNYKWRPSNYGSGYPNGGAYVEILINGVKVDRHDDGRNTWLSYNDVYSVDGLDGAITVTFRIHSNYGDRGSSVTVNEITLTPTSMASSSDFYLPDLTFDQDSNINYIIRAK